MPSSRNRPILVTGSTRSGSTWVGKMLANHPRVFYISEPFNIDHKDSPAKWQFHYVTEKDEEQFHSYLRTPLEVVYPLSEVISLRRQNKGFLEGALSVVKHLHRRFAGHRPLLKDPFALCSAEWLAKTYATDVIILIRHPAAFASSMKRLKWDFEFRMLMEQPELMTRFDLWHFQEEMRHVSNSRFDNVDRAALLWRVVHHIILCLGRDHPNWLLVRHEDLSLNPLEEFSRLFAHLGLPMTSSVARAIGEHSSEDNPTEAGEGVIHQLKRDSKANVWNWKQRLTNEEVMRVRKVTEEVASHFYSDADWGQNSMGSSPTTACA